MATRGARCLSLSEQDRAPNVRLFVPSHLTDPRISGISDPSITSTPGPHMMVWRLRPLPRAVASVTFHFSLPDGPVDYFQGQGSHADLTPPL